MKKSNYSYISIAFIILVFGIIFVPKIVTRVQAGDISRTESRSENVILQTTDATPLSYLIINGERKKVMPFSFTNQNGLTITNKDFDGRVYLVEFFFTTCPTICPKMSQNLVDIQNTFPKRSDFGIASITINPNYDTVEVLKKYAVEKGVDDSRWNLMTGNKKEIYDLARKSYLVAKENPDEGSHDMIHTENFVLVDKEKRIRGYYDGTNELEMDKLINDLEILEESYKN